MATVNPYAAPKAAIDAPIHNLRIDFYEEDGCLAPAGPRQASPHSPF